MIRLLQKTFLLWCSLQLVLVACNGDSEKITVLPILRWEGRENPPASIPFFLSSGIPLVKGKVTSIDSLLLKDADGKPVMAQFSPLAWWPDRSVKWVGISPVLTPETKLPLVLYQDSVVKQAAGVRVLRNGNQLIVENGQIRVLIGGSGGGFRVEDQQGGQVDVDLQIDRITREPQKVRDGWLAPRDSVKDALVKTFTLRGDSQPQVEVEESGPVRVVVRLRGTMIATDGEQFCRYDERIYVYSGVDTVRWQPTWIFTGDPESESIGRIEALLTADRDLVGDAKVGVVNEAGEQLLVSLQEGVALVQEGVNSVQIGNQEPQALNLTGWLSVSLGKDHPSRVNVAVKEFWQNYPSGFSWTENQVIVGLWPGFSASILDLARTSDGTGNGESDADSDANAVGVGKTFDLWINTRTNSEHFGEVAKILNQEPLFYPGSRYMTGTQALGHMAYEDKERFPRMETSMQASVHWLLANRNRFGWYGFVDYGDVRTNYKRDEQIWWKHGRYGWRQAAGDVPNGILTHYFRTGDLLAWEMGAPYVRHVLDLDTVHYKHVNGDQAVGAMHRRGQDHWSGKIQSQYTYTQGAFLYHYLSGDLRARTVLLEETVPWQATPEQAWSANAMNTVVRAWEATGDPRWRELARQQFLPHKGGKTYDNFRFASDLVPAIAQYAWLTGDEDAVEEMKILAEKLLDHRNWAYFHPSIGRTGGRFMLPAFMYELTGDKKAYIEYPARMYAELLPPPPSILKNGSWEGLADYMRRIPPHGNDSASLSVGRLARVPHFIAVLQDIGWSEKDLLKLPPLYGTRNGALLTGTYSHINWPVKEYDCSWELLSLPATSEKSSEEVGEILEALSGLPYGAILYANNIPFRLASPSLSDEKRLLRLGDGESAEIAVPEGATALYILGPMIEKGDLRVGADVIAYTLHMRDGSKKEGVWHNLTDLDDFRGFHYSSGSVPARFWQLGNNSRVHASVMAIEFDGQSVEKVELRDLNNGYKTFILAATAGMQKKEDIAAIAEVRFAGESDSSSHYVLDRNEVAPEGKAGWLMSPEAVQRLRFNQGYVISRDQAALRIPLPNGDYLVELNLRNEHILGGAVEVKVSGNAVRRFALSGGKGDRLQVPSRIVDGWLYISVSSLPGLLTNTNQRSGWEMESIRVFPLPKGEWTFQQQQNFIVMQGSSLGQYAKLSKSVGSNGIYQFWGIDQVLPGGTEYRVERPSFPQDIIFSFEKPITLTGFVFYPMAGFGPESIEVQVRKSGQKDWQSLGSWKLESDSMGVRDVTSPVKVEAVRFLMGGKTRRLALRILEVDVFGIR